MLIGLALVASACGANVPTEEMSVVLVVRDLLEPGAWEAADPRGDDAVGVRSISPSSAAADGADMPALVVPPPGEVRIVVPPEAVPSRFVARAGVDQLVFRGLSDEHPSVRFAFEVRANEQLLAREEIEVVQGRHAENAWRDLGGPEGIELTEAQTLTLHTQAFDPDGAPLEVPRSVQLGFGAPRLERRLTRARAAPSATAPNVVLVVMDTLRADRLSTYGYVRPTSPNLDALARRGTRFEECYSTASWTWPATASLLTGLTPLEHRVVNEGASYLVEAATTLPETLQRAGWTTAAWSANPIVSAARNFDQGFEHFHAAPDGFRPTAEFFEEVRAFLRARAGTRFFLYLHLADPHMPLRPSDEALRRLAPELTPEFRARSNGFWAATSKGQAVRAGGALALDEIATPQERDWTRQLYDASVWTGDHWLGELLAELATLSLTDETVVAFTSDHGEELFERGFLGHGQSLRRELVRVPLVLAGPGVPTRVNAQPVSSRILAPLLARLAGVEFPDGERALQTLRSDRRYEDFVPFMTTKGSWKGRNLVRISGLTDGKLKLDLAHNGAPWGADSASEGDWELFDLGLDPGETRDLSASRPEDLARLRAALDELLRTQRERRIGYDIPAGGATLLQLQRLGYAGDHESK
jgi:arylsulfatase A-like enzyme